MYTENDILFSLLHSCCEGLRLNRLVYYMYLNHVAGLKYDYKYKVRASGVECKSVDMLVDQYITNGYIAYNNGVASLTKLGDLYYNNIVLTCEEWEHIDRVKDLLDKMSDDDLYLIVMADIIVQDVLTKYGHEGLIKKEKQIKQTLHDLCKNYTEEEFDSSLRLLKLLREGYKHE